MGAIKNESQVASGTSNGGSEGMRRRDGELTRSSSVRDRHMRTDYQQHHKRDGQPQYAQLQHHQSFHGYQSGRSKSRTYSSLDRDATRSTEGGLQPYGSLTVLPGEKREQLLVALDKVIEKTQDFTDSAYTTHEHRENILLLCDRAKLELNQLLRFAISCEQYQQLKSTTALDLDHALECVLNGTHDLSQQLLLAVGDQVNELEHILRAAIELVSSLRAVALNQEIERLQESADRFHDYIDHILDVCRLLRHVAFSETLQVDRVGQSYKMGQLKNILPLGARQVHGDQPEDIWATGIDSGSSPIRLSGQQGGQGEPGCVHGHVAVDRLGCDFRLQGSH